jgi:hypothetical protein
MYLCVRSNDLLLSTILIFDSGIVPTVRYFFCFSFYVRSHRSENIKPYLYDHFINFFWIRFLVIIIHAVTISVYIQRSGVLRKVTSIMADHLFIYLINTKLTYIIL